MALSSLGHECVFASEIDEELRALYEKNFSMSGRVWGDIRTAKCHVPKHDILCAGFPCQPFSKSGAQFGLSDKTRGTLFHEILEIVRAHKPKYVILENVGNFERHDSGRTWETVKNSLVALEYHVLGTEHKASGGHGLVSPHHLGHPHTRERFYVVASREPLHGDPFPPRVAHPDTTLESIVLSLKELSVQDRTETALPPHYVKCIDHWNALIRAVPDDVELPSFPIWGDEFRARYPFQKCTPFSMPLSELRSRLRVSPNSAARRGDLLDRLPPYARSQISAFPEWKELFIRQNRAWFNMIAPQIPVGWKVELNRFPASLRKLEWNCKGEERDLWRHVLQFRPSGLRAKRFQSSPALVAMTLSQIPILGPNRRFISRIEGLRLQGFHDGHALPKNHERAFKALGNAVHVAVVRAIAASAIQVGHDCLVAPTLRRVA